MSMQDPLADLLTRIRNGQQAGKLSVSVPSSKLKSAVLQVLQNEGYIAGFKSEGVNASAVTEVELKYYQGRPVIESIKRISRPGLRIYKHTKDLPQVNNGFGVAIVSTSKGVISDREARRLGIGGEILLEVF